MDHQKNKMVSFRLSDEEYLRMRAYCEVIGAQNLSELARVAMQRFIEAQAQDDNSIYAQVNELRERIREIGAELDRISRQVGKTNGQSA